MLGSLWVLRVTCIYFTWIHIRRNNQFPMARPLPSVQILWNEYATRIGDHLVLPTPKATYSIAMKISMAITYSNLSIFLTFVARSYLTLISRSRDAPILAHRANAHTRPNRSSKVYKVQKRADVCKEWYKSCMRCHYLVLRLTTLKYCPMVALMVQQYVQTPSCGLNNCL